MPRDTAGPPSAPSSPWHATRASASSRTTKTKYPADSLGFRHLALLAIAFLVGIAASSYWLFAP